MFVGSRIVGFEVEAFSVRHTYKGTWGKDAQLTSVPLSPDLPPQPMIDPGEYIFTYDVTWEESDVHWASRWDLYLYMGDDQVHGNPTSVLEFGVIVLVLGPRSCASFCFTLCVPSVPSHARGINQSAKGVVCCCLLKDRTLLYCACFRRLASWVGPQRNLQLGTDPLVFHLELSCDSASVNGYCRDDHDANSSP